MNTFIYSLSHPVTNEVRYIGKANNIKERYKSHLCIRKRTDNTHKKKWIISLKNEGLKPVIDIIDEVNHSEWEFWEKHYISLYRSWGFNLTNLQKGGGGGNEFTKFSDETKLKMRLAQLGKKHTIEAKQKQRLAKIGKPLTKEHVEKVRQSQLGKKQPLSAIAKTVAAKEKPVIQFDLITGEKIAEYESARKAMTALNGKGFNLTNHLKGNRKSYMGYRFQYKEKQIN